MSKISELSDGGSLVSTDFLIAVRSGGNVKVKMDTINVDQVDLGDNEFIRLGNSQDLTLVHNASNSIINQAGIGNLLIQKAGTTKASITANGLEFPDNSKAIFGTGSDLQIYHDGTHSYVADAGTGSLFLRSGSNIYVQNAGGTANYFKGTDGGAAELFHNGSSVLATTSTGIDVSGTALSHEVEIGDGSAGGTSEILFSDNVSARGKIVYDHSSSPETLLLQTTGSTGISIDNAQNVSIPNGDLDVTGTVTADGLQVTNTATTGTNQEVASFRTASGGGLVIRSSDLSAANPDSILEPFFGESLKVKTSGNDRFKVADNGDISFYEDTGTTPKLFWDASAESLGIGTTSPASVLDVRGARSDLLRLYSTAAGGNAEIEFLTLNNASSVGKLSKITATQVGADTNGSILAFSTSPTSSNTPETRMTIDSSGNLLVGTDDSNPVNNSTDTSADDGVVLGAAGSIAVARYNNTPLFANRTGTDGTIFDLRKSGVPVGSIGTGGGDIVVASRNNKGFKIYAPNADGTGAILHPSTDASGNPLDAKMDLGYSSGRFKDLHLSGTANAPIVSVSPYTGLFNAGTNKIGFQINGQQKAQIDASGNLLVGTTSSSSSTAGIKLTAAGTATFVRDGVQPVYVNRLTNDGDLAVFAQDGAPVGSIGTVLEDSLSRLYIAQSDTGLKFNNGPDYIVPCTSSGANRDNVIDLGASGARFSDIYATNGTIQTSDRNEKQDIEALSETEQRVAVAAKGLLRKFRWKSSVEAKGDEARTHFGIIAQDLQAAFAAEGLDAGDYGMFINSTWTDEETGEERSRMGVRYSELLAFIISSI